MKRDAAGKFVNNWDLETKHRVTLSLTRTAWRSLNQKAQKQGISRSELVEQAMAGDLAFSQEYRVLAPDGSLRWVKSQGRTYLDGNGQPIRMTGVSVNITERKQIEAERDRPHSLRWRNQPATGHRCWLPDPYSQAR